MKHIARIISFLTVLILPLITGGQTFAFSQSVTQEITITATVPSHRDIIIDNKGSIVQILSNTRDDVMPDVYQGSYAPENKRTLTDTLYAAYREHVPAGTAKYGVLYQRPVVQQVAYSGKRPAVPPILFSRFL